MHYIKYVRRLCEYYSREEATSMVNMEIVQVPRGSPLLYPISLLSKVRGTLEELLLEIPQYSACGRLPPK